MTQSPYRTQPARSHHDSLPQPRAGAWAELERGVLANSFDTGSDGGYDALAELFLGDVPTSTVAPGRTPVSTAASNGTHTQGSLTVQALVLGHVPTMAAAWMKQTARSHAESTGRPVALLRLVGGEATLEVVGQVVGPQRSLPDALRAVLPVVGTLFIRADDRHEPTLVRSGVDGVLLVTSADEAGIVGAYRTLKGLLPAHEHATLPPVKLAIVGATAERAGPAAERLSKAVRTFLSHPIEVQTAIPRVNATPGVPPSLVFQGPASEDVVREVLGQVTGARETPVTSLIAEPLPEPHPLPEPIEPAPQDLLEAPEAKAARSAAPAVPADLIDLGSLCPWTPTVHIAMDRSGGVHVCARCDAAASGHDLTGQLALAATWAEEHHAVLGALAERVAAGLDRTRPIARHVMLQNPKAVRTLLSAGLTVHLTLPTPDGAWSVCSLA